MCEKFAGRGGHCGWKFPLSIVFQHFLTLLEHREHTQTLFAIGAGPTTVLDAFQEVKTFFSKRFLRFDINWLGIGSIGDRNLAFPLNRVRIKEKFVFLFHIVEHRHLAIAHDNQPLLLKWMEPRDENMGLDATWKGKQRDSEI